MELTVWKILILAAATVDLRLGRAEIVKYKTCDNHVDLNCNVSQVKVTPCAEAVDNKPCVLKRGKTANIEFQFTPEGNYSNLHTRAYWASPAGDLPWIGMDTDGCAHTTCPTAPKTENFSYDLKLGGKLPLRQYDVKWRLWSDDSMECCFLIKIKLVK